MRTTDTLNRKTPFLEKKPSSLRYFQEGPAPIDPVQWRLDVMGLVAHPLSLDLAAIRALPAAFHHRRTVCVCLWTIKRHWFGVLLRDVLALAGVDLTDPSLYLRQLSNGGDWLILLLTFLPFATGLMARFDGSAYQTWMIAHVISGELFLILAPFTKLSHIVLFFMSRAQIGMDYAIKRGGATRGGAFPW